MVNGTQIGACVCVFTFVLFISCLLFGLSWSVLEPLEAGLDFNTFTKTVDETKVFGGGRYMLGLGHSFLKYPKTFIIIDFSSDPDEGGQTLDAGTKDGQPIEIEVTLYYSLLTENLVDLYKEFQDSYEAKFVRIAQSTLKNTAVKFQTVEYFSRREEIAETMLNEVDKAFREKNAKVELLQLRGLDLVSNSFESRLTETVIATQDQIKAEFEKEQAIVEADTAVILALAQGNITQTLGQATATATLIGERARAEGTELIVNFESEAYPILKDVLGFTNSELYQYLWSTRKLRLAGAQDTLMVGFGDGTRINIGATNNGASSTAPQQ